MGDELLENANEMAKLVSLNDYIDKIEIEPRKNLIPTHNLKLQMSKIA